MKARDITLGAVLLAAALTVFVIENQIPSLVPVPGFKIGLANVFTLITLYLWDTKHAFIILILRIVIGSFIFAGGITFIYSISGGLCCFAVMTAVKRLFGNECVFVSMVGAVAHNTGQLLAAAYILNGFGVFVYFPFLCAVGVASGFFIGMIAKVCIKNIHIRRLFSGGCR